MTPGPAHRRRQGARCGAAAAAAQGRGLSAAAFAVVPIGAVVWLAITGEGGAAIPPSLIARYAATSALLGALVAAGAT